MITTVLNITEISGTYFLRQMLLEKAIQRQIISKTILVESLKAAFELGRIQFVLDIIKNKKINWLDQDIVYELKAMAFAQTGNIGIAKDMWNLKFNVNDKNFKNFLNEDQLQL